MSPERSNAMPTGSARLGTGAGEEDVGVEASTEGVDAGCPPLPHPACTRASSSRPAPHLDPVATLVHTRHRWREDVSCRAVSGMALVGPVDRGGVMAITDTGV